jgi:BASS family bile acid:Na+ symporter
LNISHQGKKTSICKLFGNRNFIFILAIALALAAGQGAERIEPLLLPTLAVAMTLTATSITNRDLAAGRSSPRPILVSLLLNYVLMGGMMLLVASWLIEDSELWAGFVAIAAVPPAVSATPFSFMLGGNAVFSLIGTTGLYLAALGLTPGIMILLLGTTFFSPVRLLIILAELIVIPLTVSRVFLFTGLARSIAKWQETAINWCFFITIYIIIGLNHQVFFQQPDIVLKVVLIATAITFMLGHIVDFAARRLHIERSTIISMIIMATRKNTGLASVIAISFFGERAAFPAGVLAMFSILFIVWLGFYLKKQAKEPSLSNIR